MIDFFAHHGLINAMEYFLYTNSKNFEKMPCKNEVFWSKMAENDQKLGDLDL